MTSRLPGLAAAAAVAVLAAGVTWWFDIAAAPIAAIVLGILLAAPLRAESRAPGYQLASRTLLQAAVVLLGLLLSARAVARAGVESLPVLVVTSLVVVVGGIALARIMRVPTRLATLIAIGTGICGASAIAAASAVLDPDDDELGYAISTVFACNVLAVLAFVPIGHALDLTQREFGIWAGTAINDTSSVVAAATGYGAAALAVAVVVKLVRVLAIVPVTLVLAGRRAHDEGGRRRPGAGVPPFVLLFAGAVLLRTLGLVPHGSDDAIRAAALALTTIAMAGVGLSTDAAKLVHTGPRPFVYGVLLWLLLGAAALVMVRLVG